MPKLDGSAPDVDALAAVPQLPVPPLKVVSNAVASAPLDRKVGAVEELVHARMYQPGVIVYVEPSVLDFNPVDAEEAAVLSISSDVPSAE